MRLHEWWTIHGPGVLAQGSRQRYGVHAVSYEYLARLVRQVLLGSGVTSDINRQGCLRDWLLPPECVTEIMAAPAAPVRA